MRPLFYCIEKPTLKVLSLGYLPEVWGNITGMGDLPESEVQNLTWAGYPDHGFYTKANAQKLNVKDEDLEVAYRIGSLIQTDIIKEEVSADLALSDWIVTKSIETGKQIPEEWKIYRQKLRDLSLQSGYPWDVKYPEIEVNVSTKI